jgi:hypothetical protein
MIPKRFIRSWKKLLVSVKSLKKAEPFNIEVLPFDYLGSHCWICLEFSEGPFLISVKYKNICCKSSRVVPYLLFFENESSSI